MACPVETIERSLSTAAKPGLAYNSGNLLLINDSLFHEPSISKVSVCWLMKHPLQHLAKYDGEIHKWLRVKIYPVSTVWAVWKNTSTRRFMISCPGSHLSGVWGLTCPGSHLSGVSLVWGFTRQVVHFHSAIMFIRRFLDDTVVFSSVVNSYLKTLICELQ
jgi:hypothetical protein